MAPAVAHTARKHMMIGNRHTVLAACVLGMSLGFTPLFMATLPTLLKAMSEDNGWGRTATSAGISVATLLLAVGMPLAGRLVDLLGVRRVVFISGALFSALLYAFSLQSGSIGMYLVLSGAMGLCAIGVTPLSYNALLARWFDQRLGTVMGFTSIGLGISYALAPLLAARWSQTMGWRGAYVALSLLALIPLVAAYFLAEPKATSETGLPLTQPKAQGLSLREAARTRAFWLILASALLLSTGVNGTVVHLVALLSDRGYPLEVAARVASVTGLTVLLSKLIVGWLLDRLPIPLIAGTAFVAGAAGILLLQGGGAGPTPFIAALCLGLAFGAEADIIPFACRRHFGLRAYGQIYGVMNAIFTLGVVIGPLALAVVFDRTGSYRLLLPFYSAFCLLAGLCAMVLGQPLFRASPAHTHSSNPEAAPA